LIVEAEPAQGDSTTSSSEPIEHDSYDPAYFERLFSIEDRHFWFRARNLTIAATVSQVTTGMAPGYRVLEVGCGTGKVLKMLEETCDDGTVIGMDLFDEGLRFARRRTSCALVQGDVYKPPFDVQFDVIGAFDVIEHLPDDLQIMRNMLDMLAPGGALILTVPAHPSLWSYFDEASHHCRRYEEKELRNKLQESGYRVEYMTQYMATIFPIMWLGRRLATLAAQLSPLKNQDADTMATDELRIVPIINGVLSWVLSQERRLIARRGHLPIGTSLLVVARRAIS
jgi:SAM-dependent methyltransferase